MSQASMDSLRLSVERLGMMSKMREGSHDMKIASWLGGDMNYQDKHHKDLLAVRADQTCEFIIQSPAYTKWYGNSDTQDSRNRQLSLLGDLGCGKSVAMAFLVDNLRRQNRGLTCCFYCRDDEVNDDDTRVISGLVQSLLAQDGTQKAELYRMCEEAEVAGRFTQSREELERYLQTLLGRLKVPVFIAIDGLESCVSGRSLLQLFKRLLEATPSLKIIFSSRRDPDLLQQLDGIASIDLLPDQKRDALIAGKMVDVTLPDLPSDVRSVVISTLSDLTHGNTIWARKVVDLIKERNIAALGPMQYFLGNIPLPRGITELHCRMISRCTSNDPENLDLTGKALSILGSAQSPLSMIGLTKEVMGAGEEDPQRLMCFIYPFVTLVDFKDLSKCQVQLMHKSYQRPDWSEIILAHSDGARQ